MSEKSVNAEVERQEAQLDRQWLEAVERDRDLPCSDCRRPTGDQWYMLRDEVWAAAVNANTEHAGDLEEPIRFLCLGCLGTRLGRDLWPRDFKAGVACNQWLLAA